MENDIKDQKIIASIKQDLLEFRNGKSRSGRIMPKSIRVEILKLRKSGWSVIELEKEFQIAGSAVYRWIKNSSSASCDKIAGSKADAIQDKNRVSKFEKPKRLKIVEDIENRSLQSSIEMELRSGIKLYIPQNSLSLEFLKSLNSL